MEIHSVKTLRSLLSALALLALVAIPALAQTGNVTVSLDCYNDPESVTVLNQTDAAITVTGVTSSSEPNGDPERSLNVMVAAGATARIAIGAEAGGSDNIFNNELNESATVYTSVGNVMPTCEEAAGIGVGLPEGDEVTTGQDEQEDMQDDQQGETPQMPTTGAGGMAGSALPIGQLAGALSIAAGYGYFLVRRR